MRLSRGVVLIFLQSDDDLEPAQSGSRPSRSKKRKVIRNNASYQQWETTKQRKKASASLPSHRAMQRSKGAHKLTEDKYDEEDYVNYEQEGLADGNGEILEILDKDQDAVRFVKLPHFLYVGVTYFIFSRDQDGRWLYQLQWAGTDPSTGQPWDPTWEPRENLNCPELLENFEAWWEEQILNHEQRLLRNGGSNEVYDVSSSSEASRNRSNNTRRKSSLPAANGATLARTSQVNQDEPARKREYEDGGVPWDNPTLRIATADSVEGHGIIHFLKWSEGEGVAYSRWVPARSTREHAPRIAVDFYEQRIRFEGKK